MNTSTVEPVAIGAACTDTHLTVILAGGAALTVPLSWYPRLLKGTAQQRQNIELIGDGEGIHWPDLDEDLSIAGMLAGQKAPGGK
jgi:hypothetical protein